MKPRSRDDRRARAMPSRPYGAACQALACQLPDQCGKRRMRTVRNLAPQSLWARVRAAADRIRAWQTKGQGTFGSLAPVFLAAFGPVAGPERPRTYLMFSISGPGRRATQQTPRQA